MKLNANIDYMPKVLILKLSFDKPGGMLIIQKKKKKKVVCCFSFLVSFKCILKEIFMAAFIFLRSIGDLINLPFLFLQVSSSQLYFNMFPTTPKTITIANDF